MKPQEIITIMVDMFTGDAMNKSTVVKTHPELDQFFDKGMYIENITQNCLENGKCIITFTFRYYSASQSKVN